MSAPEASSPITDNEAPPPITGNAALPPITNNPDVRYLGRVLGELR